MEILVPRVSSIHRRHFTRSMYAKNDDGIEVGNRQKDLVAIVGDARRITWREDGFVDKL